jgi:hypothetical protein
MFAPFCATQVHLWIADFPVALFAVTKRVVFPELYLITARRAMYGKDIFRFPHLLILAWTMRHFASNLRFNL